MLDTLNLDQLRVLIAVVDAGSFSAAAGRLKRAQSAVSYAIASLEQALGVALFDRSGWRPRLTEAGAALTADARAVLDRAEAIKARAKALRGGLEAEIPMVIEVMFSMLKVIDLVEAFQRQFPTVALNVHIASLGGVQEHVVSGACRLGVICSLRGVPAGLVCQPLQSVPIEVVAAPDHPLAAERRPIARTSLDEHLQIVLADRGSRTEMNSFVIVSRRQLFTADIGWKQAMLRAGLGWGFMPKEMVEEDIARGKLSVLTLANRPPDTLNMPVSLVYRRGDVLGPAARWIVERLTSGSISTAKPLVTAKPIRSPTPRKHKSTARKSRAVKSRSRRITHHLGIS
jgi:DNA-binding transcriptional LysR family regulator